MKESKVCNIVAPHVKGGIWTARTRAILQPIFDKVFQSSEASSLLVGDQGERLRRKNFSFDLTSHLRLSQYKSRAQIIPLFYKRNSAEINISNKSGRPMNLNLVYD